ncbi:hypothetical protein T09_11549 [Trichinella sp. T9]|nr:hypothetical protein T09_11549 [Trichinella sp. T9]
MRICRDIVKNIARNYDLYPPSNVRNRNSICT